MLKIIWRDRRRRRLSFRLNRDPLPWWSWPAPRLSAASTRRLCRDPCRGSFSAACCRTSATSFTSRWPSSCVTWRMIGMLRLLVWISTMIPFLLLLRSPVFTGGFFVILFLATKRVLCWSVGISLNLFCFYLFSMWWIWRMSLDVRFFVCSK